MIDIIFKDQINVTTPKKLMIHKIFLKNHPEGKRIKINPKIYKK